MNRIAESLNKEQWRLNEPFSLEELDEFSRRVLFCDLDKAREMIEDFLKRNGRFDMTKKPHKIIV